MLLQKRTDTREVGISSMMKSIYLLTTRPTSHTHRFHPPPLATPASCSPHPLAIPIHSTHSTIVIHTFFRHLLVLKLFQNNPPRLSGYAIARAHNSNWRRPNLMHFPMPLLCMLRVLGTNNHTRTLECNSLL